MASEAVVSFVVGKLGDLLIEEARLLYDVRDQFEWIVGELRRMQCFLKDADAKQKEDERVRNWVKEIRDVSYDAEDVIDTFILTRTRFHWYARKHDNSQGAAYQRGGKALRDFYSRNGRFRDVLIRIIECVMSLEKDEMEKSNEYLTRRLRDHLSEKRYLVVIDDIWTMQAWDELKLFLPADNLSGRVLLTTRNREVALYADPLSLPHDILHLSDDESWELFLKKIFPIRNTTSVVCPPELEDSGRKIVKKCCGLPLAIVVLGGLLSRRDKTSSVWSRVFDAVPWHLSEDDSNNCKQILALSYYDLPPYLKPCFLYVGLFPEDYEIRSNELIRLWVAEGFIQRGNQIMEDVAEDYLEELIGRSMIQVARKRSNGTVSTCRIHDLLRDLSIFEARQVNFTTAHSSSLRRVAFHRNVDENEISNRSAATLRSMLCFSDPSIDISSLLDKGGRLLRVLHVEKNLPKKIIGEELLLRYLRVDSYQSLPSFKRLSNLQVIILTLSRGTLPSAVWDLKRLRHLHAYHWKIDGHPQLSNFTNIQTLGMNGGSWIEDGLYKLTNLRKLTIIEEVRSHQKALFDAIDKWSNLRSLKLSDWLFIPPSVSFAPLQNLYKMSLIGKIENLPIQMPPNLAKLTLLLTHLQQNAIEILENLQYFEFSDYKTVLIVVRK
ncbi:Disease resistance protein [Cinnamomum micranthum f. kanehirae]|uniref:Disease resistance protein n=1 Tax=Cinnamomum micranthum f. kanehirae TaxID=337451 RepID=A0A443NEH5_9MAGN|nr:Disease resistance protein [Cinnamomum micranthum f. kanehirae]